MGSRASAEDRGRVGAQGAWWAQSEQGGHPRGDRRKAEGLTSLEGLKSLLTSSQLPPLGMAGTVPVAPVIIDKTQ